MSASGKRLRISLMMATAVVSANMYAVLHGTSNGFYAGLSHMLAPDEPTAVVPAARPHAQFAALETRTEGHAAAD